MRATIPFALALTCTLVAQEPQRPVFRSGIDLVTVDVVVVDRQGNPVTDLTAADFAVNTGRQSRTVKSAEFVSVTSTRIATTPAAEAEPAATVSSNTGQPESRSFLFVVDVEQIRAGEGRVTMKAASDYLASLGPDDRVGVVALPYGRPRVDLTTNREAVQQALAGIVGTVQRRDEVMSVGEAAAIEMGDRMMAAAWLDRKSCAPPVHPDCSLANPEPARLADKIMREQRQHSSNLLENLGSLSRAMQPLRGLKTIVLVTEGMVADRQIADDLRRFSESAAAGRVTLNALMLSAPMTEASDSIRQPPDRTLDNRLRSDGLGAAAHAAGGEIFLVSGTPTAALKQIDTSLSGYYLLSFESSADDESNKRRTIDVKVRRPGVSVRARTDFAIPAAVPSAKTPTGAPDLRARVGELLRWPVPVSDLPIDLVTFASPSVPDSAQRRVTIAAQLPGGTRAAATGFEISDDKGKVVSDSYEADTALGGAGADVMYLAAVLLDPGRYRLKFAVVASDGRRGSIEHSLWVRASPLAPLRLSDVIIGTEDADGFRPVARIADAAPMLAVRVEVQASAADAFGDASVLLDIVRPGEPKPFTSATMRMAESTNPLKRIATANLAIGRMPAGEYILRCTLQGVGGSSERVARAIRKR